MRDNPTQTDLSKKIKNLLAYVNGSSRTALQGIQKLKHHWNSLCLWLSNVTFLLSWFFFFFSSCEGDICLKFWPVILDSKSVERELLFLGYYIKKKKIPGLFLIGLAWVTWLLLKQSPWSGIVSEVWIIFPPLDLGKGVVKGWPNPMHWKYSRKGR